MMQYGEAYRNEQDRAPWNRSSRLVSRPLQKVEDGLCALDEGPFAAGTFGRCMQVYVQAAGEPRIFSGSCKGFLIS